MRIIPALRHITGMELIIAAAVLFMAGIGLRAAGYEKVRKTNRAVYRLPR